MPAPFSQTMRALHAARPAWTGLALTVLLLIAWAIWFFGSRVSVYTVSYAARLEQDTAVLERQRATAQAQVKQLDHEVERHRVRAPVGGRLAQMRPLRKGSLVQAGDTLGVVVQPGALRVVAYFLPSAAFGRVRPGQAAQLRLHGFPWTQYGSVEATVERVASEALSEGVRVEFSIEADGATCIPLQHGLPGSIEVEVERMSPAMLVLQAAGKRVAGRGAS